MIVNEISLMIQNIKPKEDYKIKEDEISKIRNRKRKGF